MQEQERPHIGTMLPYLPLIQILSRELWSESLCRELQLVCISPVSDSMMPEWETNNICFNDAKCSHR